MKKPLLKQYYNILVILGILITELTILKIVTPNFITLSNMISLGRQSAITAIVAIGMGFILISGGMDLSLGSQVAFSGIVTAWLMVKLNVPLIPAVAACIIFSSILGFINGFVCAKVHIHPFILTMALSVIYRGLAKIVNNGMPLYNLPASFLQLDKYQLFGIPEVVLSLILCLALGNYILHKTYLGKYIYAMGNNERTAEFAGIDTILIKWIVYSISGFFCGAASILLLSKVGSAQPTAMTGIELDVLVAAAIGGIGFKGGRGHLLNIVLGVLIIEIFGDALIIFDVGEYYRSIFKGLVLLGALAMDGAIKSNRE